MSIKNEPEVMDIIAYAWLVQEVLESDYNVKVPRPYVAEGRANTYCANYIADAWRAGTPIYDVIFVLCDKIQTRAWEKE